LNEEAWECLRKSGGVNWKSFLTATRLIEAVGISVGGNDQLMRNTAAIVNGEGTWFQYVTTWTFVAVPVWLGRLLRTRIEVKEVRVGSVMESVYGPSVRWLQSAYMVVNRSSRGLVQIKKSTICV